MRWIILTYLIMNPLVFIVQFNQRDIQQLFFQISSVIVFSLGLCFKQREMKPDRMNISIGVLLIAFLFAWFRTGNGWFVAQNLIFGILVYMTVARTMTKEDIRFVFKGMMWFVVFCIGVLILQVAFDYDIRGAIATGRGHVAPESIFFQRSAMGMFFAQNIPIVASINVFLSPLLLIPMIWSESVTAYAGGVAGLLFFLWFRKRVLFWFMSVILIAGAIAICVTGQARQENLTGMKIRLPMWAIVVQDTFKNPIGYGLDSYHNPPREGMWRYFNYYDSKNNHRTLKAVRKGKDFEPATEKDKKYFKNVLMKVEGSINTSDHPHNEYIWLGYEVGIHALVILGFIMWFAWQRFWRSKKTLLICASTAILVCFMVEAFFQFNFHLARIGSFFPVILGFFYLTTEE